MTCPNCTPRNTSTFDLSCIDCGVRLVQSARSDADPKTARRVQNQHLAAIEHCAGRGVMQQVVEKLRG